MSQVASESAILLEAISKSFGEGRAVDACSLAVEAGTFVSLLGPSGCGKTTLLRIIAGFEAQDTGVVRVQGVVVDGLPPNKRDVNTVFQRYALFPHRTVAENVAFPLEVQRVPKAERRERVREMLELVHLRGVDDRPPAQVSGGQAQRVALARALIGRPQVLLLDEPLAALDLKLRKAMQLELRRIQEELGTTFLYVTHDQEEALTMSDTVVLMNEGRIVQVGEPEEVYRRPTSVFSSTFIGETNLLQGVVVAADGGVRVEVEALQLVGPSGDLPLGEQVTISIRPECLVPLSRASANGVDNRIRGTVRRRIFLGNVVRSIVEVSPRLSLTVQSDQADGDLFLEGRPVELGWAKDDAVVLPFGRADG
jgi:spermidine/putrescine transport system ATP-binding protein